VSATVGATVSIVNVTEELRPVFPLASDWLARAVYVPEASGTSAAVAHAPPVRVADRVCTGGPVAAEPAYDLPRAVTNAAMATALVLLIEQRLAAVYGDLVESAEQAKVRTFAIQTLIATASTQVGWGGAPLAFPGQV